MVRLWVVRVVAQGGPESKMISKRCPAHFITKTPRSDRNNCPNRRDSRGTKETTNPVHSFSLVGPAMLLLDNSRLNRRENPHGVMGSCPGTASSSSSRLPRRPCLTTWTGLRQSRDPAERKYLAVVKRTGGGGEQREGEGEEEEKRAERDRGEER